MIEINNWTNLFLNTLQETFRQRIWFVGLQGSRGRGEATATSDIDLVVILDELSAADIGIYNAMLDRLPHRELICGFLSGKAELLNWQPSDLFQFYYDTTPMLGSLDALIEVLDDKSVDRAIKIAACNIYHGCVHNMLFEKDEDILRGLYKAASFALRAITFKQSGKYFKHEAELLAVANGRDRQILATFIELKRDGKVEFAIMSEAIFDWAKAWISK